MKVAYLLISLVHAFDIIFTAQPVDVSSTQISVGGFLSFTIKTQDSGVAQASVPFSLIVSPASSAAYLIGTQRGSTDGSGLHSSSGVLTVSSPGTYTLVALSSGYIAGESSSFTVTAATAAHSLQVTPSATSSAAGVSFTVSVRALDVTGALISGYSKSVVLSLSSSGGGSLPMTQTASVGTASFSGVNVSKAGSYYLSASVVADSVTSLSVPITITPAAAALIQIDAIQDQLINRSFTVSGRILDAFSNVVTSQGGNVNDGTNRPITNGLFSYSTSKASSGTQSISLTCCTSLSSASNSFLVKLVRVQITLLAEASIGPNSNFQYTVHLLDLPAATVTVTPAESDARASISGPLTFTTGNYNSPQTVTVNIGSFPRGTTALSITHSASGDSTEFTSCNSQVDSAGSFDITVLGNTVAALLCSSSPVLKEGESKTYTIQLTKAPTSNVVVTVVPPAGITITSSTTITLSSTAASTVTVLAKSGSGRSVITAIPITHSVSTSDPQFQDLLVFPSPFNIYVVGTSSAAILISETVVVQEGRTGAYGIVLTAEPQHPVTISLTASNNNVEFSPRVLTFTANNYRVTQYVSVSAGLSASGGFTYSSVITHTAASSDANYNNLAGTPSSSIKVTVVHPCKAGSLAFPPGTGTCEPCPQGYKCPTLYSNKVACDATDYSPLGAWNCWPCPANHACSGLGMPTICPSGSTALWGAGTCTSCVGTGCDVHGYGMNATPPGSFSIGPGYLPHLCPAGFACAGGVASPSACSLGQYAPAGSSQCQTCPAGYYCPSPTISKPIPCDPHSYSESGKTYCTVCPPGYECTSTSKIACASGQESKEGWMVCIQCTLFCEGSYMGTCALGKYYVSPTVCTDCEAGFECDGVRKKPCAPGFKSGVGQSACTPCALGTYADGVQKSACTANQGGVGFFSNEPYVGEEGCHRGTTTNADKTACVSCPSGKQCDDPAAPASCDPGYYCNPVTLTQLGGNPKVPCPGGFFSGSTGNTDLSNCSACTAGKYCLLGSSAETACKKGHYCLKFTYSPDSFPCPEGTYRATTGGTDTTSCTDCPAGTYCPYGGQIQTFQCPEGAYCPGAEGFFSYCLAGFTSPLGSSANSDCVQCAAGTYCTPGSAEVMCPPGTYDNPLDHGYRWNACTKCTAGKSCPIPGEATAPVTACQKGHVCPKGTEYPDQYPCKPGTQTDFTDVATFTVSATECNTCTQGTFCREGSTSTSTEKCPRGHYCQAGTKQSHETPCPAGTYLWDVSKVALADCSDCPTRKFCARGTEKVSGTCAQGHYCPINTKRPDQNPCPAGKYSPEYVNDDSADCLSCPVGKFCWSGSPMSYPCPRGTFRTSQEATSPSDCADCTAGHYCPEGSPAELDCPAGTMSAAKAYQCEPCTAGYYCLLNTNSASKTACAAGFYCPEGTSVAPSSPSFDCPQGFYCTSGVSAPVPCPGGTYGAGTKLGADTSCTASAIGYYAVVGAISHTGQCEPGYYCPINSVGPFQIPCPAGKYNRNPKGTDISSCLECPAGYYCLLGCAEPIICTSGSYCVLGSAWPTFCPSGKAGSALGLKAESECTPCTSGSYCSQPGLLVSDGYCTQGYECAEGTTTGLTGATECTKGGYCEPGFPVKRNCPPGTYNPDEGGKDLSVCRPCTATKFCKGDETDITTAANDCAAGYYCKVSSYWRKQAIAYPGKFTLAGSSEESLCQATTYNPVYAQSSCLTCPEGSYCPDKQMSIPLPCTAGSFCLQGVAQPSNCNIGTYNPRTSASQASDCFYCPPGHYCPSEGISLASGVNKCDVGYWCRRNALLLKPSAIALDGNSGPCPVGHFCPLGTSEAIPCASGTYQPDPLKTIVSDCLPCTEGKYCTSVGRSTVEGSCDAGYYCHTNIRVPRPGVVGADSFHCVEGEYCVAGSTDPVNCPAGTYQDLKYQSSCKDCPQGFFCPEGTTDFMPNKCPMGFYCLAKTEYSNQYPCPIGTYNPTTGLTSELQCIDCPPGYYCPTPGLSAATSKCSAGFFCKSKSSQEKPQAGVPGENTGGKCIDGYYCPEGSAYAFECDGGHYCAGKELATPSGQCSAGYYCIGKAVVTNPTDGVTGNVCPSGHYCPEGSLAPTPCPPGTYSAAIANTKVQDCNNCQVGSYCAGAGLSEPTGECAAGYYCPLLKADGNPAYNKVPRPDAFKCAIGQYCEEGSIAPSGCTLGTYQDQTLQSSCKPCPDGYYCPNLAMSVPTPCSKGHFCPERSFAQSECPDGYYSNLDKRWSISQCIQCPPGKYCLGLANQVPDGDCAAGYFCIGGAEKATPDSPSQGGRCSVGNFCPAGSAREQPCTPGSYCNAQLLSAVAGACSPGYFCKQGAKSATPTLVDEGGKCPRGHYCVGGDAFPVPCPIGYYSSTEGNTLSTQCQICPGGSYCADLGAVSVTGSCAQGYFCPEGSTTSMPKDSICPIAHSCPIGVATPQVCLSGQYQSKIGQGSCDICPAGHYCNAQSSTYTKCTVGHKCPAGVDVNGQIKCNDGYYQPFPGQSECIECPPGTYCLGTPAGTILALTTTEPCPKYKYCLAGSVFGTLCPRGTYTDESTTGLQTKEQCKQCRPGRYCINGKDTDDSGSTLLCDAGYLCESGSDTKTPNSYTNTGVAGPCPEGHYCLQGAVLPTPCPTGKVRGSTGGKTPDDCTDCLAGYYCINNDPIPKSCPQGSYCPPQSQVPTDCLEGFYSLEFRATSIASCLPCPAGYYCNKQGIGDYKNFPCEPGYYCPAATSAGLTPKVKSPAGKYSPTTYGDSEANLPKCPGGYYCKEGQIGYNPCGTGYYCPIQSSTARNCLSGNFCEFATDIYKICPAGWYCPLYSSLCTSVLCDYEKLANLPPLLCAEGTICPEGSSSESPCGAGYIAIKARSIKDIPKCEFCRPGSYALANNTACATCDPGYVCLEGATRQNPTILTEHRGYKCPAGYYCPAGTLEEIPCGRGTYSQVEGSSSAKDCLECPSGTYTDTPASLECLQCQGFTTSPPGSQSCVCTGSNRVYMSEQQECICKTGYVYFDNQGSDKSKSDSDEDCSKEVYARCSATEVRSELGKCTSDTNCSGPCAGSGKRTPGSGICECKVVDDLSTVCNKSCRAAADQVSITVNREVMVTDPVTGKSEVVDAFKDSEFGPSCYPGLSCSAVSIQFDDSKFKGLYGSSPNIKRVLRERRLATTPGVGNPVVCLENGETLVFDVDAENYPVYVADAIINSNPDFDYSKFVLLKQNVTSETSAVKLFAFTFIDEGTYLFQNADDSDNQLLVGVMSDKKTCPFDSANVQPRTLASLNLIGATLETDIILQIDWVVVIVLLLSLVIAVLIFVGVFYYYARMPWIPIVTKKVPYRQRNLQMVLMPSLSSRTNYNLVIDGKEADSSESDREDIKEMLFETKPEVVAYEPTDVIDDDGQIDNELINAIKNKISDNNKDVISTLEQNAAETQERLNAIAHETGELRDLLERLLDPLDGLVGRAGKQFIQGFDPNESVMEEASVMSSAKDFQDALDEIADSSHLMEQDKQKLINELNSEFLKMEKNLKESRSRQEESLAARRGQRDNRRRELARQKRELEKETKDAQKRQNNEVWALNAETEQVERMIEDEAQQEKQEKVEEVMGEPAKQIKREMELKLIAHPERKKEILKEFEKQMEALEKNLTINQMRQHQDNMRKLEERRKQRKLAAERSQREKEAQLAAKHREERNTIEQRQKEIQVQEAIAEALPILEEETQDEMAQMEGQHKQELKEIEQGMREEEDKELMNITRRATLDEGKFNAQRTQLERQRQKLIDDIAKSQTQQDTKRLMAGLSKTEDKLQLIAEQQSQQQKKNLEERLDMRRKKREDRLRDIKSRHQAEEQTLIQTQKQRSADSRAAQLSQAINKAVQSIPVDQADYVVKSLLEEKHSHERAELQERLKKRLRKAQKQLIKDNLKAKANDLQSLRQEYREKARAAGRNPEALAEVQQAEGEAINRLDYYYMKQLETAQEDMWREGQARAQQEMLELVDLQLVEMRRHLRQGTGQEELRKEFEDKMQAEKAKIEEDGLRKLDDLNRKKKELETLKALKQKELEDMIRKERGREEMARKRDDLIRQKRELEEKQRLKREELERRGKMTKEEMERLLNEHQRELRALDGAVTRERDRQMALLGSKLAEKKNKKLEYEHTVQKMKEEQDKWQKEMDELPGITHKQATTLLLKWRRYPKRNLKEVERSIRTQEPKEKAMPVLPAPVAGENFIRQADSKLDEITARIQKIEGVIANVDVHQFSSIMHALDTLEKAIKSIS